jgi:septum formation protein
LFSRALPPLILASTSPYRRALLERFALPFEALPPKVPEDHLPGESPADRARRLADAKAQALAGAHPEAIVIGSDQVAASGATVLDKPGDARRCEAQLTRLSGSTAHFYTACTVLGVRGALRRTHLDTTTVSFRVLSAAEIGRYVEREQPFDCAGGFKAEGAGIALFESIQSQDPTALIGLPLIWLAQTLREAGFDVP